MSLADEIMRDVSRWKTDTDNKIQTAAERLQGEMFTEIESTSPKREYPWNGGVRMEIESYNPLRKRQANHQPGDFNKGWVKSEVTLRNVGKVYAVRNKKYPQLTHLVNFKHMHKTWGRAAGEIDGNRTHPDFVSDAQDKAAEKFGREIERILNNG